MWASQIEALCDKANVLAPDLPGFGASGKARMPEALDGLAEQIYEGSRERGIDRAVVAGCSMGGYLAFAMLRVAPKFVRGLALINTKATADPEPARAKRLAQIRRVEGEGCAFLVDEWPPGHLSPTTLTHNAQTLAHVRAMIQEATPQALSLRSGPWRSGRIPQRYLRRSRCPASSCTALTTRSSLPRKHNL